MKIKDKIITFVILTLSVVGILSFTLNQSNNNRHILSHIVDLKNQTLKFYWKNEKGENFNNFGGLKNWLKSKKEQLTFATNGGMYNRDQSPQGLYIEHGETLAKIDTVENGYGNFYMQPNGIFYITNNNKGVVCKTKDFKNINVKYATQSGPLLLIDGRIHSKFMEGSKNLNIRNGVGILPNGNLLFAMSKEKINFYDFATYFKSQGCKNALYLDGFVSKTYLPDKNWKSIDGKFGVMIGETKTIN
ncbi:MAG: phosphodiester glycosidase family protein [Flavobacteriales bacterium]